MKARAPGAFGAQLRALRDASGFTQEELATIAGLSVHSISALERGERRRPHVETVRALLAALDLTGPAREALLESARPPVHDSAADELSLAPLPLAPTPLVGRDADCGRLRQWLFQHLVQAVDDAVDRSAVRYVDARILARRHQAAQRDHVGPAEVHDRIAVAVGVPDVNELHALAVEEVTQLVVRRVVGVGRVSRLAPLRNDG